MTKPDACTRCGAPWLALFTTKVCSASCDADPPGTRRVRRHGMDLGEEWVLWTRNAEPPTGWTHGRIVRFADQAARGDSGLLSAGSERPSVAYNAKFGSWTGGMSHYVLAGDAGWARNLDDKAEIEGIAYKVAP